MNLVLWDQPSNKIGCAQQQSIIRQKGSGIYNTGPKEVLKAQARSKEVAQISIVSTPLTMLPRVHLYLLRVVHMID